MDMRQYRDRLQRLIDKSKQKAVEQITVPAANKLLATVKNRIMVDGENSQGRKIGQYSTTPIYASKSQFDKTSSFKPQGKAGKPKRGAKKPKTMYLPEGYKELRQIQGKPVDKINLNYSGDLMASYQQQVKTNEIVQGLISEQEALKREGLETRFGKVLRPQQKEIDEYQKEVIAGQKELISKTFAGA